MFEAWLISLKMGFYLKAFLILIIILVSISAVCHAAIYKRESRAAVGWCAFIISAPFWGSLMYFLLGLNRIQRKALKFEKRPFKLFVEQEPSESLRAIFKTGEALAYSPVVNIKEILSLNTGDQAYPKMLSAIKAAKKSIYLFSYIFELDQVGEQFVMSIIEAHQRGVQVRVLVDGLGSKATLRALKFRLEKAGIPHGVFLPILWRPRFANLRNHRKILVIDSEVAFTGGLNIAQVYWPRVSGSKAVWDFHFLLKGEIVAYVEAVFLDDWYFSIGEEVKNQISGGFVDTNVPKEASDCLGRVIVGGPGENVEKIQWHLISAINSATKSIKIISPYFLPSQAVESALIAASLRGVLVEVVLPQKTDRAVVTWAMHAGLSELLRYKIKFFFSGPQFDHSKLFLVDDNYVSLGSSNWDVRSFRLNFEMNVEVVSKRLNSSLTEVFRHKKAGLSSYSLHEHESRSFGVKLRGGISRMLGPYL